MSADNGIYILKTKDGWRVAHLQAIENIYFHPTCCENPNVHEDGLGEDMYYHEVCDNCGAKDPEWERQEQAYLPTVYNLFHHAAVWESEEGALAMADALYKEVMADDFCPVVEYGIQHVNGLEEHDFTTMCLDPKESND